MDGPKSTTSFILIVRSFTCRLNHDMRPIPYLRTDARPTRSLNVYVIRNSVMDYILDSVLSSFSIWYRCVTCTEDVMNGGMRYAEGIASQHHIVHWNGILFMFVTQYVM